MFTARTRTGSCFWLLGVVLQASLLHLKPVLAVEAAADRVIGQANLQNTAPNFVDAIGFNTPVAVAIDASAVPNRLYVADSNNSRVLGWSDAAGFTNGEPADLVIGQANFNDSYCNRNQKYGMGGTSKTLCYPSGITVDNSNGRLFVADTGNARVLAYDSPFKSAQAADIAANKVFGRANFSSDLCNLAKGRTADTLCVPAGVVVDGNGNLYISDGPSRILGYANPYESGGGTPGVPGSSGDRTADLVFGQAGDFTTYDCKELAATSLCNPGALATDASGNLYAADAGRVLEFDAPFSNDTAADRVFGRASLTENGCSIEDQSQCFSFVQSLWIDGSGRLWVLDSQRILKYETPLTDGAFDLRIETGALPAALHSPSGVAVDSTGNLYVSEYVNRVLRFDEPLAPPNPATGQKTGDALLGAFDFVDKGVNSLDAMGIREMAAVAVDHSVVPNRLYVADRKNNRVLGWHDSAGFSNGDPAEIVIGQVNFRSGFCNGGDGSSPPPLFSSRKTLCDPAGVAVDRAGNLWVADTGNHRVLEFDSPMTTDSFADRVFGQSTFKTFVLGGCNGDPFHPHGPTSAALCGPEGVAVDQEGNLFVADTGYNRVLEFDTALIGDHVADRVFGQPDFTTIDCAGLFSPPGTPGLCRPNGVVVDGSGNLFVSYPANSLVIGYRTPLRSDLLPDQEIGQSERLFGFCAAKTDRNSLCFPTGLAADAAGRLFVADTGAYRVLRYDHPFESRAATFVFGQRGDFRKNDFVCEGPDRHPEDTSFCRPSGVAFDASGNLFVADDGNARVLSYSGRAEAGTCEGRSVTIKGTDGDDVIEGTPGDDVIDAGAGNDIVNARAGNDVICGGDGDDTINGGGGNDLVLGQIGNDSLAGGAGDDVLRGGRGADHLDGGDGTDQCIGGLESNTIVRCE